MLINDSWQDEITMTMEGLLIGTGWHEVEMEGDFYIRWSGPETKSSIQLNPCRDVENRMNITIHSAADEEIINGLQIKVDSIFLDITIGSERDPAFLTAILPKDLTKPKGKSTKLTFIFPKTLPLNGSNGFISDERLLGISLRRIDIFPLSRSLFVAQKFSDPIPFDGLFYMKNNPGVRESVIHGLHKSAYDFFLKNDRIQSNDAFSLNPHFDECPGDIYDILKAEFNAKCRKIESRYLEKIEILRNTIYRQSDTIANLKKKVC